MTSPIHAEAAGLRLKIAAHCTQAQGHQVDTLHSKQTKEER